MEEGRRRWKRGERGGGKGGYVLGAEELLFRWSKEKGGKDGWRRKQRRKKKKKFWWWRE